jgi:hypothetical protein
MMGVIKEDDIKKHSPRQMKCPSSEGRAGLQRARTRQRGSNRAPCDAEAQAGGLCRHPPGIWGQVTRLI